MDVNDISPAQLRALADRLEAEAQTKAEEREAERLQAAVAAGEDARVERIVEGLSQRMKAELAEILHGRESAQDEDEGDDKDTDGGDEDGRLDPGAEEESGAHGDILPGRWRPRKLFGAKLYSGAAEPETVRFRNDKGQIQSRPGRVPGRPYQVEWEQVEDGSEPEGEAAEDAA